MNTLMDACPLLSSLEYGDYIRRELDPVIPMPRAKVRWEVERLDGAVMAARHAGYQRARWELSGPAGWREYVARLDAELGDHFFEKK